MWDLCREFVGITSGLVPCNAILLLILSQHENTRHLEMIQNKNLKIEIRNEIDLKRISENKQRLFYISLLARILELRKQELIKNHK